MERPIAFAHQSGALQKVAAALSCFISLVAQ
jgi:hypothetical protein